MEAFLWHLFLKIVSEIGDKLGKFMEKKSISKTFLITEMEKICVGTKESHPVEPVDQAASSDNDRNRSILR
jgi:hypothetical protein